MIIDTIENAGAYMQLGPGIWQALEFLGRDDLLDMATSTYAIQEDAVYAIVNDYETKPLASGVWEAHRRYIDVQYVAQGVERLGYANVGHMKVFQDYDEEKDVMLLEGQGDFVTLHKGMFAILCPQDVHMPGIALDGPAPVRKIVVKVRADG